MKNALIFGRRGLMGLVVISTMGMAQLEEKLGAGVTLRESTSIADVVKSPESFVGKTIRVDGTATAICQHMGCWMAVSESSNPEAPTVRLKVDDGVIVFPVKAKGKSVSAQGVFERVAATDAEGREAASEHAKRQAQAAATYQLKATGAIIR